MSSKNKSNKCSDSLSMYSDHAERTALLSMLYNYYYDNNYSLLFHTSQCIIIIIIMRVLDMPL